MKRIALLLTACLLLSCLSAAALAETGWNKLEILVSWYSEDDEQSVRAKPAEGDAQVFYAQIPEDASAEDLYLVISHPDHEDYYYFPDDETTLWEYEEQLANGELCAVPVTAFEDEDQVDSYVLYLSNRPIDPAELGAAPAADTEDEDNGEPEAPADEEEAAAEGEPAEEDVDPEGEPVEEEPAAEEPAEEEPEEEAPEAEPAATPAKSSASRQEYTVGQGINRFYLTAKNRVRFRKDHTTKKTKIFATLKKGTPVWVQYEEYDEAGMLWSYVIYKNKEGWIQSSLLTPASDEKNAALQQNLTTPLPEFQYIPDNFATDTPIPTAAVTPAPNEASVPAATLTPEPVYAEGAIHLFATTNTKQVHMRKTASTKAKNVLTLKKGVRVWVLTSDIVKETVWYQVRYGKKTGWVRGDLLTMMTAEETAAILKEGKTNPPFLTATPAPVVTIAPTPTPTMLPEATDAPETDAAEPAADDGEDDSTASDDDGEPGTDPDDEPDLTAGEGDEDLAPADPDEPEDEPAEEGTPEPAEEPAVPSPTPMPPVSEIGKSARLIREGTLRTAAGSDGEAVAVLPSAAAVMVNSALINDKLEQWYYLTAEEAEGWLPSEYVEFVQEQGLITDAPRSDLTVEATPSPVPEVSTDDTVYAVVVNGPLSVWDRPSTDGMTLTMLARNQRVIVLEADAEQTADWTHIRYADVEGYVLSAYLAIQEDVPLPTAETTDEPEAEPTEKPTLEPAELPTVEPAEEPEIEPTEEPEIEPAEEPTLEPVEVPTIEPTVEPTAVPTLEPTEEPTPEPTEVPTPEPSPTPEPTPTPSPQPTATPFDTSWVKASDLSQGIYSLLNDILTDNRRIGTLTMIHLSAYGGMPDIATGSLVRLGKEEDPWRELQLVWDPANGAVIEAQVLLDASEDSLAKLKVLAEEQGLSEDSDFRFSSDAWTLVIDRENSGDPDLWTLMLNRKQ